MMVRLRTRDAGFHHTNIELMIVVAVIAIIAAIALPQYIKYKDQRAMTCLNNLLALADGKPPAKKTCPAGDKAYATGTGVAECPSPANHLESAPRFVRASTGSWSLKQTFPASEQPISLRSARLEVQEKPGRASVLVKPGAFMRFFFGPLIVLIFTIGTVAGLVGFVGALWSKKGSEAIGPFFGMAVAGVLAFFLLKATLTSQEWIFEREGARATRVEYQFGRRTSETTFAGCLGVVPAVAAGGHRLQLIHPPDAEGNRLTVLGMIDEDRLDVAGWFNRALVGP